MQTAMPHVVGGTPVYTAYTYDGIGRTLSVVSPDGASTTTYSYQGNLVTVTDPAGKQKTFTMDAFGNLTQVQEPNPQGGSAYVTTYTYDLLNNLSQVSMPRPTGTQTRTFVYNGPYLMSATNPENGTVSYTYNSIYKVATKTDAKGQQVQYTYDTLGRLTQVHRFIPQNGQLVENTCQEELYSYDTNPYDSSYSGYYTAGRLTAVQYYFCAPLPPYGANTTFTDMYNYSQAGGKTGKRLQVTRAVGSGNSSVNLDGSYTYDNEGRMTAEQYPSWDGVAGPNLGYAFDTMGRLNTMTDLTAQSAIISGTTYGPSNELLTMGGAVNETRTYNSMLQLLSLVAGAGPTVSLSYAYSSTQNNGKITSQTDNISGEQVVYTYDALNRLASATATSNSWGQSYSYDGFGNLTGQTVTAGSAPSYQVVPDPSTNHLGGEDANGNTPYTNDANGTNYAMTYDIENRYVGSSTGSGTFAYGYAPGNKRIYRGVTNGENLLTDEVTYWSASGQKLATYQMVLNGNQWIATQTGTYYWFGGKLIKNEGGYVTPDRLGSIGHFYPYGQEKPSATTNVPRNSPDTSEMPRPVSITERTAITIQALDAS
ncbi:MAG: hypothetical protein ABSB35_42955 [Bryobacteraceae bacterium]|jgi:YD repeat-containing protein